MDGQDSGTKQGFPLSPFPVAGSMDAVSHLEAQLAAKTNDLSLVSAALASETKKSVLQQEDFSTPRTDAA